MSRVVQFCFLALLAMLGGCATSTQPGAVGIKRQQLLMVPSAQINAEAASAYVTVSNKASERGVLNKDQEQTTRVRGIADKLVAKVGTAAGGLQ
jgi:hypothetical protein